MLSVRSRILIKPLSKAQCLDITIGKEGVSLLYYLSNLITCIICDRVITQNYKRYFLEVSKRQRCYCSRIILGHLFGAVCNDTHQVSNRKNAFMCKMNTVQSLSFFFFFRFNDLIRRGPRSEERLCVWVTGLPTTVIDILAKVF